MKKPISLLAVLLLAALTLSAVPDRRSDAIAAVRKAYQEAKESMAINAEETIPSNDLTATYHYNIPGCGETTEVIHAWFYLEEHEEDWGSSYPIYFITRKYNIAAGNYYEEYLFDDETGKLIFAFLQGDDFQSEGVKVNEERYYYDAQGLAAEIIKGRRMHENDEIVRNAEALRARLTLPDLN